MPSPRSALFVGLALAALCGACGDGGGGAATPVGGGGASTPAPKPGGGAPYDKAKGTATLKGLIKYAGTAPAAKTYDMSSTPACGTGQATIEKTEVNANSTLPHAFVLLVEGPETSLTGFEPRPVVIDQKGCTYIPHVFGVMAGQDVTFKNGDGLSHNVNVKGLRQSKAFNCTQGPGKSDTAQFAKELNVRVICDVHSWMNAFMHVTDHPFYATSARGDGAYEIKGLYPGKHKFKVWHENWAPKGKELSFEVDLKDGDNVHDVDVQGDK